MDKNYFTKKTSDYLKNGVPFIFIIDFELQNFIIYNTEEALQEGILFDIKGFTNLNTKLTIPQEEFKFSIKPISIDIYSEKFDIVKTHLQQGDTKLLNLTFPTKIKMNYSLQDVFARASAPYKLLYKNIFTVFSPETFISTLDNKIYTYPMKGTIDAKIDNATQKLMNNKKESEEHSTIVSLLKNDLSVISDELKVTRYRYIDKIKTHKGEILQTSSEIRGCLRQNWQESFATDLIKLLPAGSISGSPKEKSLEIINKTEIDKRKFYSGIFGAFDGKNIDSAVAIRYIEQDKGEFIFRSGGGITIDSNLEDEYNELIQKVYVPFV